MESTDELSGVPGVPESALPAELAARLPETAPGPPWRCRVEAVLWCHRAGRASSDALPQAFRPCAAVPATFGMMIRYSSSPVGPYTEVAGSPRLIRSRPPRGAQVHVPFMAVDSLASLRGGRANWALPKALAEFSGRPADGAPMSGSGAGWHVEVAPRAYGPRVPFAAACGVTQLRADGSAPFVWARFAGLARLARVDVDVASTGSLARWLQPGRHAGVVITRARLTVGPPR